MPVNREEFLSRLLAQFPEVFAEIKPSEKDLLHCEVAAFRLATENAMDTGHHWAAELHFRFVEQLLKEANPELRNALEISYLEDLALGKYTPMRYQAVKERMPKTMRSVLIGHNSQWQ
jgi:hypothetical protein